MRLSFTFLETNLLKADELSAKMTYVTSVCSSYESDDWYFFCEYVSKDSHFLFLLT